MEQEMKKDVEHPETISFEKCGIIMPISTIDGCSEQHWSDVKEILTEAIVDAHFDANLVSNAADVGIIQKNIIQNIYDNPIVVCDVSGKNPNVMFELGMRLAFDKPTIIVIDDKTTYSFDTSPIEHLTYPRDLRFNKIVEFKRELSEKITATVKKSKEDPQYSTFLKHFGRFTVAKLETTEVSKEVFILEELKEMKSTLQRFAQRDFYQKQRYIDFDGDDHTRCDDIIMQSLSDLMMKMDVNNIKMLDNMKMRKMLINSLVNSKMLPPCFSYEKKICINKVYEIFDRLINSNNLYQKNL